MVLYICIICKCYFRLFKNFCQYICVQESIMAYGRHFMLVYFSMLSLNWILWNWHKILQFLNACNQQNVAQISITCLQGHIKNSDAWVPTAGNGKRVISCYFMQFLNKFIFKSTIRCLRIYNQCAGQFKMDQIWFFLLVVLFKFICIFWINFLNWITILNILFILVEC